MFDRFETCLKRFEAVHCSRISCLDRERLTENPIKDAIKGPNTPFYRPNTPKRPLLTL